MVKATHHRKPLMIGLLALLASYASHAASPIQSPEVEHLANTVLMLGDSYSLPDDIAALAGLTADERSVRQVSVKDRVVHGIAVLLPGLRADQTIVLVSVPNAQERIVYVTSMDGVLKGAYATYPDRRPAPLGQQSKEKFAEEMAFWFAWEAKVFKTLGARPPSGQSPVGATTR